MKRLIRYAIVVVSVLALCLPLGAVFKEKDLPRTLSVLHFELRNAYLQLEKTAEGATRNEVEQHKMLVKLIEDCNELSLMLYSQQQDFTFDLTYALEEVTAQYLEFNGNRMPYDDIVSDFEIEIDRYEKLVHTLMNLPPSLKQRPATIVSLMERDSTAAFTDSLLANPSFVDTEDNPFLLDEAAQIERDSCLFYAQKILDLYWESMFRVDEDNSYYTETDRHLKEAYNYAQDRYRHVQKKIFIDGQDSFPKIFARFRSYAAQVKKDCTDKYSISSQKSRIVSEWRGPMVVGFTLLVLFYIIVAVILANLMVRLLLKKVAYFHTPYFKDHQMMFILLAGVLIFGITITVFNLASSSNFMHMALPLLAEFAWLLAAIFTSMLIRLRGAGARHTLAGYLPSIVMGLLIITFRIIFIPNSLINMIFPPVLLGFSIWQLFENQRRRDQIEQTDRGFMWAAFAVFCSATVLSWLGYVMMALLVMIWWIFQLTVIQTILAVYFLMTRYYNGRISRRLKAYREKNPDLPVRGKGSFIEVSWAYDLLRMVIVPVAAVWSLPGCIFMAGKVFDLSQVILEYFYKPFLNVDKVIHLSLFKVVVVVSLYYVFRYLNYSLKAFYRVWQTRRALKKMGSEALRESAINFTLSDNIISLLCWGLFVIISFLLLKIPTSAITIISTGLATGIGFALKDVLNNFFYGIQLMSGRLRVGDVIECDGIRGTVDAMSYQSTQIVASDGAVIAFPNSTLFSKNFKNLTRNHSYELLKIPVGVAYGTDVEKVRALIIDALKVLQVKDKYGREVVEPKSGVTVRFDSFGDNSVNLIVSQFTTVDTHFTYAAQAKEIIYNTLTKNGIEIPFPQQDVYIRQLPQQ